jgi:UDP-3-O-[3-hydroxymyristoyl] glucosamine N-acyltransferase LpxD
MILSILPNTKDGMITYYVGDNIEHIKHLKNCKLLCKQKFEGLDGVVQEVVEDPQLEFYKLSHKVKDEYIFHPNGSIYKAGENCLIHHSAIIGEGVIIGDNVTIGPNTTIYSKSIIGNNTRIDANCVIGAEGMMWTWDGSKKVFLRQLGGVVIGDDCIIGSGCNIVRGSANENTIIEDGVNMAPGCCIGHGSVIGEQTHLANNVSTGGSSSIAKYNFIGSSAVVSAGVKIESEDVILGAGSVITKNINENGVYVGLPARRVKAAKGKMDGIPKWRK